MNRLKTTEKGKVLLTGTIETDYTWEHVSPQHVLVYIYSGEMTLTYGKHSITFVNGDTVYIPKNELIRVVKKPDGTPFKAVSIFLPDEQLRKFYIDRKPLEGWEENIAKQRPVLSHPLLDSFFSSLFPYFEMQDELPPPLVTIKIQEILTIIDEVDKRVSSTLGTFSEMGKVDLKKYMEEHYMYNLSLERFAFLTGRSLSTFKSDFKKIFNNTPGRWLMEKRLELAHYKITSGNQKSNEVYLAAGFENLSHFSFAFKKAYGYSPSSLNR